MRVLISAAAHCPRYATLALERGMLEDAIRVGLRLLVQRSTDASAKALLAQCLLVIICCVSLKLPRVNFQFPVPWCIVILTAVFPCAAPRLDGGPDAPAWERGQQRRGPGLPGQLHQGPWRRGRVNPVVQEGETMESKVAVTA